MPRATCSSTAPKGKKTAWFQKVMSTALAPQQNIAGSVVWENRLSASRPPAIKSFCKIYSFF